MFHKTTLLYSLFLGVLFILWGFSLAKIRSSDIAFIKQAIKAQGEASTKNVFSTTEQQRKGVVKEIWFSQEDQTRLHYRIRSESSLLTIQPKGKGLDLIEKLHNIQCWMQDKLYSPSGTAGPTQQLRFFAAEEGLYRYTSQEFLAQSVALSLFRLNGHDLPKETVTAKPFLKGLAKDVSFGISGKNPQFQAKQFKAELNALEERR
jgi:hypothetical protein